MGLVMAWRVTVCGTASLFSRETFMFHQLCGERGVPVPPRSSGLFFLSQHPCGCEVLGSRWFGLPFTDK